MDFHGRIHELIERIQLEILREYFSEEETLIKYLQMARECVIERQDTDKAKCYLKILLEYSWEKLNTGIWQNVKDVYRYLYSYACYLDVLIDCMKIERMDDVQVMEFGMRCQVEMFEGILVEFGQEM